MDWLGIGVFILAIGFAILVFIMIPVIKNLEKTLGAAADTITTTQKGIEDITSETAIVLNTTNETLLNVNDKLKKLDPLFDTVNDAGKSAQHMTSSLVRITGAKAQRTADGTEILDRNNLEGILRGAAFIYYLTRKKQ
ncbi:uncharacterized protein YoxC [Evansella vedderi]|uniref:Uncharacterized protein YoxC n=1 Tax=Evansella vedderi TaxID=38282 RepID=A0ABT9ZS32_9BACI|nr:DUF948 domain-containing protein [Evansella vedderi]MDQ0254042.1 uncharacterized protein YoxC [Evansella vedderi]